MPTTVVEEVQGFVHCLDPFCVGNRQREAQVVRTTNSYTFFELGGAGSVPGIERSATLVNCADEADAVCPECKGPCDVSDQKRPVYPNMRRDWAQDGLLNLIREGKVQLAGEQPSDVRNEVAELKAQLAEMKAAMEEKRGPGRPRKNPIEGDE